MMNVQKRKTRLIPLGLSALIYASLSILCLSTDCYAQQLLRSDELITKAEDFDGQTVVYKGEIIGEVMKRGAYAWINIHDGKNAVGVWARQDMLPQIDNAGSFKARGDILQVTGVFHKTCLEHGADMDIHADTVEKISAGAKNAVRINPVKKEWALRFFWIAGVIWILSLLKFR